MNHFRVVIAGSLAIAASLALAAIGCGGDTYCQSGAKYGTQCYSLSDVHSPPGQRPPGASEPPNWWQPAPPVRLGPGTSPPSSNTAPVPMSSPAWRPTTNVSDGGVVE